MLLGKLEPKHIPRKLVYRRVKLRCIFPFALAKKKEAKSKHRSFLGELVYTSSSPLLSYRLQMLLQQHRSNIERERVTAVTIFSLLPLFLSRAADARVSSATMIWNGDFSSSPYLRNAPTILSGDAHEEGLMAALFLFCFIHLELDSNSHNCYGSLVHLVFN